MDKSTFKFIAGDLLKQDGKTIKDLADILEKDDLSYRTIYEYFRRGGGSLEIAAKIARGMNRTLNDIYIPINKAHTENSNDTAENNTEDVYTTVRDETRNDLRELMRDGSPEVREAARSLNIKLQLAPFMSPSIECQCIAYLTASPEVLKSVKDLFYDFCLQCRHDDKLDAAAVIGSVIDRYTSPTFKSDADTITYLGIQLAKCGYDNETVRCFKRAEELADGK